MVTIVDADARWPADFARIEEDLRDGLWSDARRIDHIGSTSVPGLASKDVIDIQVTVADEQFLERVAATLERRGWRREGDVAYDHQVPGLPTDLSEWRKIIFDEPQGTRPSHLHVRVNGRANQRYALLFRDYLRVHPHAASAYAEVKRGLASLAPDSGTYAVAKDPACDLIYFAAESWASEVGWV